MRVVVLLVLFFSISLATLDPPAPAKLGGKSIPLQDVSVSAVVRDLLASVTVTQIFINTEDIPIEAVYVFPLDEKASITSFEATIDDMRIVAEAHEMAQAQQIYDEAISQGNTAYLLQEQKADIFKVSIGNLPSKKTVVVKLTYITELSGMDQIKFVVPTAVAPRYSPPHNPEFTPEQTPEQPPLATQVPYRFSIFVDVNMGSDIEGITSPTHELNVNIDENKATATLKESSQLDRDFVVVIAVKEPHKPRVYVEVEPNTNAKTILLAMDAKSFEQTEPNNKEIIFLVDNSGSMGGEKMDSTKQALQIFLKSLPSGSMFNIIRFSSDFSSLFSTSQPYDAPNYERAKKFVENLHANGGTNIWPAFTHIYSQPLISTHKRVIIALTDGEVGNTEQVINGVLSHADDTQVYSLGVGYGASHHLVNGIARAGRGMSEFVIPSESKLDATVIRQLSRAASNVPFKVNWNVENPLWKTPLTSPPLYFDNIHMLYVRLGPDQQIPTSIEVEANGKKTVFDKKDFQILSDDVLFKISARSRIRDFEEGGAKSSKGNDDVKDDVVKLAVEHNLASTFTSFVGVEYRLNELEQKPLKMERRSVPILMERSSLDSLEANYVPHGRTLNKQRSGGARHMAPAGSASPASFGRTVQASYAPTADASASTEGPSSVDASTSYDASTTDESYTTSDSGTANLVLLDVAPLSIGIEDSNGFMRKIIPRNSIVPTRKSIKVKVDTFTQKGYSVKVYEGERPLAKDNRFLEEFDVPLFMLSDLEIQLEIDVNGVLFLTFSSPSGGTLRQQVHVSPLAWELIERIAQQAEEHADQDQETLKNMAQEVNLPIPRSLITKLLLKQNFDGYWELSDISSEIGVAVETLKKGQENKDEKVLATSYVTWILEKLGNPEEYSLISQKASKWVDQDVVAHFRSTL